MPTISVYIPDRIFYKLSYYANKENLSVSRMVEKIVEKYLEQLDNQKMIKK